MSDAAEKSLEPTASVAAQRIARVYAEALLNAAEKNGEAEAVFQQLDSLIADLFKTDPQFEAFLASGAVGRKHKQQVLEKVFSSRASQVFYHFLQVLNDHDRLDLLRTIYKALQDLRDLRARRLRIQVRSAVPLPADQRARLQQELKETFHLEPILDTVVDPNLLGGMIVRVGDWLYDASVKNQLETIRNQLLERSSHEIQSGRNRFSIANGN